MRKDLSLYIHIPFCKTICLYCNFLTFAHKNKWIPEYVDSVCKEIQERGKNYKNSEIETIFFGGGTPSLIEPELITKIIEAIKASFSVKKDLEISIECNPESVDLRRLEMYQQSGITRFSLGVQTLNAKTLWRVARPHDSQAILDALELFKRAGIKNFSTDFIMGLPDQDLASFQYEIEKILSYDPAHLSSYFLSYDTKKIDLFIAECPQEDEQIAMYEWLCRRLKKSRFVHYEVSNWAHPGYECEHNKRYWQQKDYLGLGIGAHSIVDNVMWENQKDFDGYLQDPMKTENESPIDADLKRMEYLMLSLRTNKGIELEKYAKFGDTKELLKNAKAFLKSGDLKKSSSGSGAAERNFLTATEKGFLILNVITEKLI